MKTGFSARKASDESGMRCLFLFDLPMRLDCFGSLNFLSVGYLCYFLSVHIEDVFLNVLRYVNKLSEVGMQVKWSGHRVKDRIPVFKSCSDPQFEFFLPLKVQILGTVHF